MLCDVAGARVSLENIMKERESGNADRAVTPDRTKPAVVPVIDGTPPSRESIPSPAPEEKKAGENGGKQAGDETGRQLFTRVENRYTFRPKESNHITGQGVPGRDRLNPRNGD